MSTKHDLKRLGILSESHGKYALKTPRRDVDAIDRLQARKDMGSDYMRAREREERMGDRLLGSAIRFEQEDISPYLYPLDGDRYDPDPIYGPRGTCPICNNERAAEIEKYFIEHFESRKNWGRHRGYGFDPRLVLEHLVNHVGLIYSSALESCELKRLDGKDWTLEKRVGMVIRSMEVYKRKRVRQDRELDDAAVFPSQSPSQDVEVDPQPGVSGRPEGGRAKEWYAYSGGDQIGALRPWGDRRVSKEIEKKSREAIVFYDEMLDVRARARRIYDEIMDDTPDGEVKNYAAAVAATREIKGVAMDMAKLALIATKYGDEKDKVRQISPSMKSMLDEIGIFERDEADDVVVVDGEPVEDDGDEGGGE